MLQNIDVQVDNWLTLRTRDCIYSGNRWLDKAVQGSVCNEHIVIGSILEIIFKPGMYFSTFTNSGDMVRLVEIHNNMERSWMRTSREPKMAHFWKAGTSLDFNWLKRTRFCKAPIEKPLREGEYLFKYDDLMEVQKIFRLADTQRVFCSTCEALAWVPQRLKSWWS